MESDAEVLQLSGLQHFVFCRRQWALIHIEQLWAENFRTVDGALLHEKAHDTFFNESRKNLLVTRGMYIQSTRLGVSGQCDVLEFHADPQGITLHGREGKWKPFPVEYKRGTPREDCADDMQLCAQAMCLEEMLCCQIAQGALYYGETRRRRAVTFTPELRQQVETCLSEMHELFARGYTPKVKPKKGCAACSLKELCLPKLMRTKQVSAYLREQLEDDT